VSQKFVDEVSPRSGRKNAAHGVRSCEKINNLTQRRRGAKTREEQLFLFFAPLREMLLPIQGLFHSFVSRGLSEPSLTPHPSPARAREGCRRRDEGSLPQGLRPRTAGQRRPWATILRPCRGSGTAGAPDDLFNELEGHYTSTSQPPPAGAGRELF